MLGERMKVDTPDYIAVAAVVVALLALWYQVLQSNRQARLQNFLTYSQRYQEILVHLPTKMEARDFDLEELDEEKKEEVLRWLRAYFDLCSEQFYLKGKRLVEPDFWRLWEGGIVDSLRKPGYVQGWKIIQRDQYFSAEFSSLIEDLITRAQ